MPAVGDVGRRFIAPAGRHCTLGDIDKPLPRAMAAGPFASSTAAVVRNAD